MSKREDGGFIRSACRHFLFWGVCASLSVTVSTIADAVLVGNFVGDRGLAVSNMATPVFMLYALLGVTLGTGANVLIGRSLGAAEVEEANRTFNAQVLTGAVVGVLTAVVSLLFRDALCVLLGAGGDLLPLARSYLTVVFASAPAFVLYDVLSLSVRTDGDPRLVAVSSAVVIGVDVCLDLVFMCVFHWGLLGASASLCIAETLGTLVLLPHFFKKHALLRLRPCLPRLDEVKQYIVNGFGVGSACIFQGAVMLAFNKLLLASGPEGVTCVAVYGVIYTVSTIPFAVFDGAAGAVSTVAPILAGERDAEGVWATLKQGLKAAGVSGGVFCVLLLAFAGPLATLFGLDPDAVSTIAAPALALFAASLFFTGVNTVLTAFWQAEGRSRLAGWMSIARNLLLPLILGALLIPRYQVSGLSLAFVFGEAACLLGALAMSLVKGSKAYLARLYPTPERVFEREYPIAEASVAQLSADLERLCEDWDIGPKEAFFINLMVEEVLLNIIRFGLGNKDKDFYLAVRILESEEGCILRFRDNVRTYNPFEATGGDAVDSAVLTMIQKKSKHWEYQRKLVFNYLYLII